MTSTQQNRKPGRYDFARIEARWQRYWEQNGTFRTLNPGDAGFPADKPKYYILDMFPYPSGAGLHVGHPVGYCATDIIARYKRMCGFNVLHPMGFDAFGLPAEQYAVEHNVHPAITTRSNIDRYRRQLKMFGFSYDWSREIVTCDPTYYKFTQWIFLRMFESWYDRRVGKARPITELIRAFETGKLKPRVNPDAAEHSGTGGDSPKMARTTCPWSEADEGTKRSIIDSYRLAYLADVPVNWCPALGTVLANEEVTSEGRSDRGNHPVYRRPLRQWLLRITDYADRLLTDLEKLDWPEPIKIMQRNWIGKSTGADVVFPLAHRWSIENGTWICCDDRVARDTPLSYDNFPHAIRVYTTRPDTLFGATYMVLAPEHELVAKITTAQHRADVEAYVTTAQSRSEFDRTADTRQKTGVFTGAFAINPVTGKPIPIWVADYVLMSYGTGAIMAVPGGDTRDFEFACVFDLPIIAVVRPRAAWIKERIGAMAAMVDRSAARGFEQVANEFPELAAQIAEHRERSAGLGDKTVQVLRDNVGTEQLRDHYVRHPKSWGAAFTGDGVAVQSPGDGPAVEVLDGACSLDGLSTPDATARIIDWLERSGLGRRAANYKLRDWLFSRQRYWGEPFPMLRDQDNQPVPLDETDLPVELPKLDDFKPRSTDDPTAEPTWLLANAPSSWREVTKGGKRYRREFNTMPQWAGSCWYYLRFIDPHNAKRCCDSEAERYWMPIDLYIGGAEHAVLHLLYARFWHKVLYDLGFISTREPFRRLFNQGMIQGFAYRDKGGRIIATDAVEQRGEDQYVLTETGEPVARVIAKMSKSLKNVVNPDDKIADFGADTFRLYEMYMGPLDASKPWNTRDVPGLFRLCQRIWRLVVDESTNELSPALTDEEPDAATLRALHKSIKRVTEDLEQLKLNTAIAALFDFVNFMTPRKSRPRTIMEPFVLVLSPFAPHLGEELWHRLGHDQTLAYEPWPRYDESLARDEEVEIAVQINGKVKARVLVPADADEDSVKMVALTERRICAELKGRTIRKVIVVKGRLVNVVAD